MIELGRAGAAAAWAGAAAVLGLGIVVSGLRGRTSGVLGFFAVVALVISAISSVAPTGDQIRFSSTSWSPASIEQATARRAGHHHRQRQRGLDRARAQPALDRDVIIPLRVTAGDLTIIIPNTVPVRIDADLTMSSLDEGGRSRDGPAVFTATTTRPCRRQSGPQISGAMSSVSIQGGN